jgi:F-box interacting protein
MWNPATREVHRIPPPTPCLNIELQSPLYGFGADDPNSTNFKVVKVNTTYDMTAEVYSLSTKSWIPTQNPPPFTMITRRHRYSKFNTLVNGVYHWITNYPNEFDYDGANILCFDFKNDQFQQLTGPFLSYEDCNILWDDIAEIKGSLAYVAYVLRRFADSPSLKIWVLDQSGWNKTYNIYPGGSQFLLGGLWKNCTQFFGGYLGGPLTSYDHQRNTICKFQIDVSCSNYWVHEYVYVSSIAPLARTRH